MTLYLAEKEAPRVRQQAFEVLLDAHEYSDYIRARGDLRRADELIDEADALEEEFVYREAIGLDRILSSMSSGGMVVNLLSLVELVGSSAKESIESQAPQERSSEA